MSLEQQLRDQLDRATHDVVGGPDLARALHTGRTRRRRRRLLAAGTGVTALAAAAVVGALVVPGGAPEGPSVAADPARVQDGYVAGTDLDDRLVAAVARHVPAAGRPDDVYPSDWDHAGPMPDADFADATDWQAAYSPGASSELLVFMGWAPPDERSTVDPCRGQAATGDPGCESTPLPDGSTLLRQSYESDGDFVFYLGRLEPSGFSVGTLETVTATDWAGAVAGRTLDDADLRALVRDPDLAFPLPASRALG